MNPSPVDFPAELRTVCHRIMDRFDRIPSARKDKLRSLSDYIDRRVSAGRPADITAICTHNSRRSHLAQLWLAIAADYFGIPGVRTFSGGTEATALHPNAVQALRRIGLDVQAGAEGKNPVYRLRWTPTMEPYRAFSKRYGDAPNPQTGYAAVMVCSQADAGCPIVTGCDFRLSLPYDDPKVFDGTAREAEGYDERLFEIGRDMLYVMRTVADPSAIA